MSLVNQVPVVDSDVDSPHAFGTSEYSERMIRPGANVGFFGWLAILGIPFLLLFLIYTKMENPGVVSATREDKMAAPVSAEGPATMAAPPAAAPKAEETTTPAVQTAKPAPKVKKVVKAHAKKPAHAVHTAKKK